MRSGQRVPGVDVLKGLAVCCMVFAHTVQLLPPGGGAYTWFAYYVVNVAASVYVYWRFERSLNGYENK